MRSIVEQFSPILEGCLRDGEEYRKSPPKGPPPEYATLSSEEQESLSLTEHGENLADRGQAYSSISVLEDPPRPVDIPVPDVTDLADTHICGIDGSNQRVERGGFHLILCRAVMVAFRYSMQGEKPYFRHRQRDAAAVVWVDGNIFKENVALRTLPQKASGDGEGKDILPEIAKNPDKPLMFRYRQQENRPSSYALGFAVKIMQALEMLCIEETPPVSGKVVCIKDGPLFSTSATPQDVLAGLAPIFRDEWAEDRCLVACSKRVRDSTLLLEALLSESFGKTLRDFWFPNQTVIPRTLQELPSDSVLLPRILKPGQRSPFMAATPIARSSIVAKEPRLEPVSCYYLSRTRPHTYIRLEIPRFMWEQNPDMVEYAIKITAWQHELGRAAPLALIAADEQCSLSGEREILERRTDKALWDRELDILEDYHG